MVVVSGAVAQLPAEQRPDADRIIVSTRQRHRRWPVTHAIPAQRDLALRARPHRDRQHRAGDSIRRAPAAVAQKGGAGDGGGEGGGSSGRRGRQRRVVESAGAPPAVCAADGGSAVGLAAPLYDTASTG